jgi:hypothetical protein
MNQVHLINKHASSSHVGPIVNGLIPKEEKSSRRFPEVHKHQVLGSLSLSKASPGAYSSYRTNMICFTLLLVMYCALLIGYPWMIVIGCMVVPFRILSLCSCFSFYD